MLHFSIYWLAVCVFKPCFRGGTMQFKLQASLFWFRECLKHSETCWQTSLRGNLKLLGSSRGGQSKAALSVYIDCVCTSMLIVGPVTLKSSTRDFNLL